MTFVYELTMTDGNPKDVRVEADHELNARRKVMYANPDAQRIVLRQQLHTNGSKIVYTTEA